MPTTHTAARISDNIDLKTPTHTDKAPSLMSPTLIAVAATNGQNIFVLLFKLEIEKAPMTKSGKRGFLRE